MSKLEMFEWTLPQTIPSQFSDGMSFYEILQLCINKLKEIIDYYAEYETSVDGKITAYELKVDNEIAGQNNTIQQYIAKYNELKTYVDNYFASLDVQTEINAKLESMKNDGTLSNIINNELFSDIKTQLSEKALESELIVERNRITALSTLTNGSTTGDAELIDLRTGENGITYANAGSSVRGQITDIKSDMYNLYNYILKNQNLATTTPLSLGLVLDTQYHTNIVVLKNTSTSSGYFSIALLEDDTITGTVTGTQLINAGQTLTLTVPIIPNKVGKTYDIQVNNANSHTCSVSVYYSYKEDIANKYSENYMLNTGISRISNYPSKSISNGTITASDIDSITVTSNANVNTIINLTNNRNFEITSGDYTFTRIIIESSVDTTLTLSLYTIASEQKAKTISMKAGKKYDVYLFGVHTNAGTLKAQIQLYNNTTEGTVIIHNLITCHNNVCASTDFVTLSTLQNVSNREIIVDSNNDGHGSFSSIRDAVIFATTFYDVANVPVTVKIKNGTYTENPTTTAPYSAIPKLHNMISIIGESRDGVIINCTCTSTAQGKCIETGGESVIENLTINMLNDGTYTRDKDLGHNPYCIHNDTNGTNEKYFITKLKNLKLYSECFCPVGAGLGDKQTQVYESIECVYNSPIFTEQGALYVHSPYLSTDIAKGLVIDNCTLISLNGAKAMSLPNVVGSQQYTDIPVSIRRTIGTTTGTSLSNVSKATHKLNTDSALNNVSDWNY